MTLKTDGPSLSEIKARMTEALYTTSSAPISAYEVLRLVERIEYLESMIEEAEEEGYTHLRQRTEERGR